MSPSRATELVAMATSLDQSYNNNNNNIHICIAPYGRNFRGAGPGSVLVGVRRGKRVSLGEEKCL